MRELIFIYNAKSGIFNALIDWGNYLKSLKIKSSFYYIDHLADLEFVPKQINLPCVYIKNDDNYQLMIDADELNSLKSVQDLISRLNEKLN